MKYLLLITSLLFSSPSWSHGSSHPTHCTYARGEQYDLISTCTKDSRTWKEVTKNWYAPEEIAKREAEKKAREEFNNKWGIWIFGGISLIVACLVGFMIWIICECLE